MKADLHTHSSRSDGVLAPAELVRLARQVGLDALALTDHDSLAGLEEAREAGLELGIEVIAGVELSVRNQSLDEHLLGFFVDPTAPDLVAYLDELQANYKAAVDSWIAVIRKEEALASVNHTLAEVDKWEQAHFEEDEMRSAVKEAKAKYEDFLREKFFGF